MENFGKWTWSKTNPVFTEATATYVVATHIDANTAVDVFAPAFCGGVAIAVGGVFTGVGGCIL